MVFCEGSERSGPARGGRLALLLLLCAVLLGAGGAEAAYFVRVGGGGDGTTWEGANGDLQAVLDQAAEDFGKGHVPVDVHVAKGTYTGKTFVLPKGVRLWGGYPESLKGTAVTGRDVKANVTTLDGEGVRRVIMCDVRRRRDPRGHGAGRLHGDGRQ